MLCLREHPFLCEIRPEHLETLAGCGRCQSLQAGEYLWRQGEQSNLFYLIQSGQIALEISIPGQGSLRIETIGAGEVFGWSWLVPPYRWQFDVRTVTDVRAVVLDGTCLRRQCELDISLGYALLKRLTSVIGHRLQSTRLKLFEVYGSAKVAPAK